MRIALLATGNELIEGTTLNTNTYEASKHLHSEGFTVGRHVICGDDEDEIQACMLSLLEDHDALIVFGGLGPTSDDKTRFALSKALNTHLIPHEMALTHVQKYLNRAHLTLDAGNHQQSLFPESAKLLANPFGTALGCIFEYEPPSPLSNSVPKKVIILLPGPPRECLPMFQTDVRPYFIEQGDHSHLARLRWLVFGLPEAYVAAQLDQAVAGFECETGYRFDPPYVECKVRCKPEFVENIKAVVEPLLNPHCLMPNHEKASHILKQRLSHLKNPIYIQDTATGGMLQHLLTSPETYAYLRFEAPSENFLSFECRGLTAYWNQERQTETELSLTIGENQAHESVRLPYRSPLVVYMATEWLCAKILFRIC